MVRFVETSERGDESPAEPRLIQVELPGLRISALEWGPAAARLVLCIHGFPDSAHGWRFLATRLAAHGYHVVAPFMRGYAPTGPAPDDDYCLGALMSDIIALEQRLAVADDTILIGHDWGGWAAGAIAAYGGSPFCAHIALALAPVATISVPRGTILCTVRKFAHQLRMSWYILFFQVPVLPQRALGRVVGRLWKDWSPRGSEITQHVAYALDALPTIAHRRAAVSYYRSNFPLRRRQTWYAGFNLFRFKIPRHPMLLLYGEQDGAILPTFLNTVLEALPPGSRSRTVAAAGHFLQIDQPEAVCAAVLDYIGARPERRRYSVSAGGATPSRNAPHM
jgi:pimeloyl-ACP methyl ester carboxylesterase